MSKSFVAHEWNKSSVLKEVKKFPKQGFFDFTFDMWLHKATFWSQVPQSKDPTFFQLQISSLISRIHNSRLLLCNLRLKLKSCMHWQSQTLPYLSKIQMTYLPCWITSRNEGLQLGRLHFLKSSNQRMEFDEIRFGNNKLVGMKLWKEFFIGKCILDSYSIFYMFHYMI